MTGAEAKQAIEDAGLTRRAVAAELEVTEMTLGRWYHRERLIRRDQYALERAIAELLERGEND